MIMGALLDGFAHSMLNCRFYGNYETQIGAGAAVNLTQCLIIGNGGEDKADVGIRLSSAGRLDHCTIVNCRRGVAVERGIASVRNSVLANCTDDLIVVDAQAVVNFTLAKSVLSLGQVTMGTTKVGAEQWAEFVKATPRFADNAVEALALAGPLYLLPAGSPNFKRGDYDTTPGACALTTPYEGWKPLPP